MKDKTLGIKAYNAARRLSNSEVFVADSSYPRHRLKERVIKEELIKYECSECQLGGEWNGKKLILQLDHINGRHNDHRIENLRFICPNCHTQQDTYAAKNRLNPDRVARTVIPV